LLSNSDAAFEIPVCASCGSDKRKTVYSGLRDVLYETEGDFTIVRCMCCGLMYLCPRPDRAHISQYYPAEYAPFAAVAPVREPIAPESWRSRTMRIARHLAISLYRRRYGHETATIPPFGDRRVLDVGCGAGQYLQDLQRLGWDVYGVDVSARAVEVANTQLGMTRPPRVSVGAIETLDTTTANFDLITMNHCLEHVDDPKATLTEAYNQLSPNGLIRIIVPDVSGLVGHAAFNWS